MLAERCFPAGSATTAAVEPSLSTWIEASRPEVTRTLQRLRCRNRRGKHSAGLPSTSSGETFGLDTSNSGVQPFRILRGFHSFRQFLSHIRGRRIRGGNPIQAL